MGCYDRAVAKKNRFGWSVYGAIKLIFSHVDATELTLNVGGKSLHVYAYEVTSRDRKN